MSIYKKSAEYDIVVVGGGLSGMCAAVSAARQGVRTAIVQNRSMFGGTASSEIRMHICGANCHSSKANMRETGIIEEILLENKSRNPYASFNLFDMILWEKIHMQKNLDSYLNTNMDDVVVENGEIKSIICHQNSTETEYTFTARIFVDATGHGTLGTMAGAVGRIGSESRYMFSEPTAPEEANTYTMGNTLMFVARDCGEPVKFIRPQWAYQFSENDLRFRPHETGIAANADGIGIVEAENDKNFLPEITSVDAGYWWIELGGNYDDIISQGEVIRDELLKCVYGVWDHLKNAGDHGIENYDLEWVGIVPGCRESRRLDGDYILTENDIRSNRIFDDAVAYGGWPMDVHLPGGLLDFDNPGSHVYNFEGCYTIPYRCYYSKNIDNLMLAGRDISASKMAFSSVRVMGTCSVGGQAVGTAAALAVRYGCHPREIGQAHLTELQQQLLKDDCYIPGFRNEDATDLARLAQVSATSESESGPAVNVINGISRSEENETNYWESAHLGANGETLRFKLSEEKALRELRITFDTDLSHEIMPSIVRTVRERQIKGMPPALVKDYKVSLFRNGEKVREKLVKENVQRLNIHQLGDVKCDEVKITVMRTYGLENARIFEVRIYAHEKN